MTRQRLDRFPLRKIRLQRADDLVRKVQNRLISALAGDEKAAYVKIQIVHIDAHALAHADARAQKQ